MIVTQIAGVSVRELAQNYGTPCYVYDQSVIEQRIADLKDFGTIRYAQKACSNIAILDLMRRHGVMVDAVSAGEIFRAMKAGYTPDQIVYTADVFDHPALDAVVEHHIMANCGSPDMIIQLGQRAPGRKITLRINPGFGHGHSQKTNTGGPQSKHGIWHQHLKETIRLANQNNLTVSGIHMHIGSGSDLEHLSQVCSALEKAALMVGESLETISAGGGLSTPYRPGDKPMDIGAYTAVWKKAHEQLEAKLNKKIELEVEPGRYLVAESGYMIAEIRAIKEMGDNIFYLLNAGFNNLARPVMYGAYHPMSIAPANGALEGMQEVVVGGPLCESGDIFTQAEGGFVEKRRLPKASVGDFVVVHCAGAYGYTMNSNYNSFPLVAEVLIADGKAELIRERQSMDDLIRGERIPSK